MTQKLVTTDWLTEHLDDPAVRVVEVDWDGLAAFDAGHIPGALGWRWKEMLWDSMMRQFPSNSVFQERMSAAGISRETTVVVYGVPVQFGTYAWWVLNMLGHPDVRLLDGGLTKWRAEGRAVSTDVSAPSPVDYVAAGRLEACRALRDDVISALGSSTVILDHRSFEEYSGERVGLPGKPDVGAERYGRVPGARHVPFDALLNDDTSFKSPQEIADVLAPHVSDSLQPVISYCRLAHRATLASFAMTEILGFQNVRVYDGSWTEWGSLVGVPIER